MILKMVLKRDGIIIRGGYTWNKQLIPDPLGFQAFLHGSDNPLGHPLATSLNGHSQSGIGPCQANYSAFAKAIGKDPANQALLHCDMANATWTQALFDTMLDPKGIDYCKLRTVTFVSSFSLFSRR